MTSSSYSSTRSPRIVIVHGLNNNLECFGPLRDAFAERGFECELVALPGHSQDRSEAGSFEEAYVIFRARMDRAAVGHFAVVGFSTGALYLQLWLRDSGAPTPCAQILLAPALQVRRDKLISKLIDLLPGKLMIPSRSPRELRRYPGLFIWEYRVLYRAIRTFQASVSYPVPTLILVDPKDDLVNAPALRSPAGTEQIELFPRPYLWKLGHHHILFHPKYFQNGDWERIIQRMIDFLSAEA